jgi:hypothetical protein
MGKPMAETCPYLSQSREGTGYCTLAEQAVRYEQARYKALQLAAWNLLHHDDEMNRKILHNMVWQIWGPEPARRDGNG